MKKMLPYPWKRTFYFSVFCLLSFSCLFYIFQLFFVPTFFLLKFISFFTTFIIKQLFQLINFVNLNHKMALQFIIIVINIILIIIIIIITININIVISILTNREYRVLSFFYLIFISFNSEFNLLNFLFNFSIS